MSGNKWGTFPDVLNITSLTTSGDGSIGGDLSATGDIFTVQTVDYGGTSTIVGWSALTAQRILIKKIGKMVFVHFNLDGTSDDTVVTFTLPHTSATTTQTVYGGSLNTTFDNGAHAASGTCKITSNSSTVTCLTSAAGAWTGSGSKQVIGFICFETA